jgi:hypothetical protein
VAGRIRLYFEGDSTSAEAAAKRAEHSVDGLNTSTKEYGKSVDESSRSTDRSTDSLNRHSSAARNSGKENDRLSSGLRDLNTRFTSLRNSVALLKWPALISGASYAAEGLGELSAGAVALTAALAPLSGALVAYPGYLGAFAQGLGVGKLATFGVSSALKEMTTVQQGAGVAAKTSGKAIETAAEGVKTAEEGLTSAQVTANQAQRSLTVTRKEAVAELQTLKDASVSAALGEQRSTLSLQEAKQELRKALAEPSKHSGGELESMKLSVKEAKQSFKESRESKQQADKESAAAQRHGVSGNPKVVEGKKQLSEANHGVALAAHAIVKAQQAETEAMEETSKAATGLSQQLESMPAAGQKFVKFLFGLQPKLKELQSTAASGLLPGVEEGIRDALPLLPKLNTAVGGTSKVMGELATKAGEVVGSKGFGKDFQTITKGNEVLIARTGDSGLKWADALRQVLVVGQPLLMWMSKSGLEFSTWVDNAAKAGRQSGTLSEFFDKTRHVMEEVESIAGSLATAFFNIGKQAAPLGEEILGSFESSADSFQKWTESMKGENEIAAYFREAKPGIYEVGRLIRDITDDFVGLSKGPGFAELTRAVRTELLPVFDHLLESTGEVLGPALVKGFVQVGKLLGTLSGTSGPLTMFVEDVTAMLSALNWGFKNIPGLATFVITLGGIATVEKALKFTGMVTGLKSSLGLLERIAVKLGFIQTMGETGGGVVGGAPLVTGSAKRTAATTVEQGATASGWIGGNPLISAGKRRELGLSTIAADIPNSAGTEREAIDKALQDAGLLSGGAAASKGSSLALKGGKIAGGLGLAGDAAATVIPVVLGVTGFVGAKTLGEAANKISGHHGSGAGSNHSLPEIPVLGRLQGPEEALELFGIGGRPSHTQRAAVNSRQKSFGLDWTKTAQELTGLEHSFTATMGKLESDAILGMGAINTALGTGLGIANKTWEQTTPQWRHRTAEAMKAAIEEIRQGMKAGTISTEEGQKRINQLLNQIHVTTGHDPFGLAEATTKQFKALNEISAAGVASWTRKLERMPVAARAKTREATEGMLAEWAAGHPKIEAQVDNLTEYEIRKFGATNKQIREGVKKGATGPVAEAFKEAAEGVSGALTNVGINTNDMLKALGVSTLVKFNAIEFGPSSAKHLGAEAQRAHSHGVGAATGFLPGQGLHDTVPIMAAPGEAVLNRHQQAPVNAALEAVYGFGLPGLFERVQTPHYMAKGGMALSGPKETTTIAHAALQKVGAAVNRFLASKAPVGAPGGSGPVPSGKGIDSMDGHPVAAWIWKILESARKAGVDFTISSGYRTDAEQTAIYESGVRPAAVPKSLGGSGSNHEGVVFPAGAVDISPGQEALNEWLLHSKWANTLIYAGSKDPVHFSHPHDGGYSTGGVVGKVSSILERNGLTPISTSAILGSSYGESGWDPSSVGSGGDGLWGFTASPVSPADLAAYASSQGKPWDDAEVQTQFMLHHFPTSMRNAMNKMGSVAEATTYFVENWERPETLASLPTRIAKAEEVLKMLGGSKATTTSGGRGAGGGAPKSVKPAIGPATSTGNTTRIGPGKVAAVGGLSPGVITAAASWMPAQFKNQLKQPGLSLGEKLSVANEAVSFAEATGTSAVGGANYGLELEEANKKRIEAKLKKINQELSHSTTAKKQAGLQKQREGILSNLSTVKSEIGNFKSALKGEPGEEGGSEGEEVRTFTPSDWANAELAEAELTPGKSDDRAVEQKMLGIAEQELAAAKSNNDPEAIASAAQAVKQLTETLKQTNVLAEETLTTSAELAEAELTPGTEDDEAARKKLLQIAEAQLANAEAEDNREAIIQYAGEVKGLREAVEASNEIALQKEGFEKEQLEVNKRLAKIAEEQGPAFMGAFVSYLDGAIGGPLQTNSRLATAAVSASYQ